MSSGAGFDSFSVDTGNPEPDAALTAISQRLEWLQASKHAHNDILGDFLCDEVGNLHPIAPVLVSIANRSFGLISGFGAMVRRRNATCAYPLLRVQIDTALRLHAFELVDDQQELLLAILDGGQINHMTSRGGKKFTDKFLHTSLSTRYPWISRSYEEACGFVHFSKDVINSAVDPFFSRGDDKIMSVRDEGPVWPDAYVIEALDAFIAATKCVMDLTRDWTARKK